MGRQMSACVRITCINGDEKEKWIDLPLENDLNATIENEFDFSFEYFGEALVTDYEMPIPLPGYIALEDLDEVANYLQDLEDEELDILGALAKEFGYEHAVNIFENDNYEVFTNCENMEEVAMKQVERTGLLDGCPELIERYFDYEAYGADLELDNYFIKCPEFNGYIEIID